MAQLTDLSEALLLQILDHLSGSAARQRTLYDLCLVCKLLSPVARECLFLAPECHWLNHNDIWLFTSRLVRTLLDAEPWPKIRRLHLHIPTKYHVSSNKRDATLENVSTPAYARSLREGGIQTWIRILLRLCPYLQYLELNSHGSNPAARNYHRAQESNFLKYSTHRGIESCGMLLDLHTLKLCNVPLTKYALILSNLKTLEIDARCCITDLSKQPDLEIVHLTVHYPVELLCSSDLIADHNVSPVNRRFAILIAKCSRLKHLHLYFLENEPVVSFLRAHHGGGFNHLCRTIVAAAGTLETLDLTASAHAIPISRAWLQVLAPIDTLRHFCNLKSLRVYRETLYRGITPAEHTNITALPASLERLQIWRSSSHVLRTLKRIMSVEASRCPRLKKTSLHDDSGKLIANI
jgi:hypothetical protein